MTGGPDWPALEAGETVRWRGSRATRLIAVALFLVGVAWVVAVLVLGSLAWLLAGETVAVAVVAVLSLVAAVVALTQVQTTRNAEYACTDRALYVKDGVTFTRPRRIDHAMIRDVRTEASVFERYLGLGIVVVDTELDEVWLFGLESPVEARDRIRESVFGEDE